MAVVTPAAEKADLAEAMVPVACDLACRVRDGDTEGIARLTASLTPGQAAALPIILAAMIPVEDSSAADLLAWTDSLETIRAWRQEQLPLPTPGRPATEPCGTYAAARRHQRHGEALDPACDRAMKAKRSEYGRNRRDRERGPEAEAQEAATGEQAA